jgi:hypothetical protein
MGCALRCSASEIFPRLICPSTKCLAGVRGISADVSGLVVPTAGQWEVRLDLLVTDFEKLALEGSLDVQP